MLTNLNLQLLLDTHVFVWLMNGDEALSSNAQHHIEDVVKKGGGLAISSISLWEISMLQVRNRIILNQTCLSWFKHCLSAPGMHLIDLTPEIVFDSCNLPHEFHGDPADRIIVATARLLDIPLVTRDQAILNYGKKGFVRIFEA